MNKDLCVQTRKAEHHKCWRESNRYNIEASTKFMLPSTMIPCRNVSLDFAVMKILLSHLLSKTKWRIPAVLGKNCLD